jgi:hypothetical protein
MGLKEYNERRQKEQRLLSPAGHKLGPRQRDLLEALDTAPQAKKTKQDFDEWNNQQMEK